MSTPLTPAPASPVRPFLGPGVSSVGTFTVPPPKSTGHPLSDGWRCNYLVRQNHHHSWDNDLHKFSPGLIGG